MTVIAIVLAAAGALHLSLLPFIQLRAALPAITAAIGDAEQRVKTADAGLNATAAALEGVVRFRRALDGAPSLLYAAIADLVARGRRGTRRHGDPYKARITVASDAPHGGTPAVEDVLVEEAIRREIGRHVEALSLSLEAAMGPLRALTPVSAEAEELLRAAGAVSGAVMALNGILREAFAADPTFWRRLGDQDARFGTVSAGAAEAARNIENRLQDLNSRLTAASAAWKSRLQDDQAAVAAGRAEQGELQERLREFPRRLGWSRVDLDDALRLYPIVVGWLAVLALFNLWHVARAWRAAVSRGHIVGVRWNGGGLFFPARRSVLFPVALLLLAAIHAAVSAVADRALFISPAGTVDPAIMMAHAAAYAALILVSAVLFVAVARGLGPIRVRPSGATVETTT